ncbi:ethanolamine permease [Niastella vici]|uniref:Ethanolamine permease n=1 Tax=Niastella vici TaxID=1703345 RepID=A0A1V9FVS3_9BACT|nr:ethanolamine permease [Niastella vici]OQP62346.1 ethanolamine permease [Niastella vici]
MHSNPSLNKVLRPVHLWALAVGLVISGEYFGWNLGWKVAGTGGFLIATVLVTIFYITFIFSYTELTAAIPQAGGPFAYAHKALGPLGALVAGYATLVEFLLAPPAVAFALGSYVHFLYPSLGVIPVAIGCFVVFTLINFLDIKESALFSLVVTLLAVAELLLFMGIVAPGFRWQNFKQDAMPFGWGGVFAALPFAIWFYLAIEGVAMVAEEVKDPQRTIPRGYIYGIVTLVLLALGVMFFTGGVTDWHKLASIDYPLPEAISIVLGKQNGWTKVFAGIGLFGLIASFHGIIISYSRQLYAMARSGYLPAVLATVNKRFRTPHIALLVGGGIGIIVVRFGNTNDAITLSALGALMLYIVSMISLLVLRRTHPNMERPFKVPLYPWFPWTALVLAVVCLIAIIWYNPKLSIYFFGALLVLAALFMAFRRKTHQ